MSTVKRIAGFFDRVKAPLSKISGPPSPKDEELILAVIQRIEVDGEDATVPATFEDPDALYRRLMLRLDWQLKNSGLTPDEILRTYPREAKSILIFKSYEKTKKKKESAAIRDRLIEKGFKAVQPGIWVLPPTRTPPDLDSQDALRLWFRQNIVKQVPKNVDYVFPFIASVDLKKIVSERRGIRKMPAARTLFGTLSLEEVAPPAHLYAAMKAKGRSVKEIILSGDIPLLSRAFAEKKELEAIQTNELEIGARLRHATGSSAVTLEDLANLGPESVAKAVEGFVPHPKDFGQRLIVEAQYWMRHLGGTVPT
ncbi:MAG: hypothetical protein JRN34_04235 [Nitrososphaerota archaeon]|jgi:hypothetical protein|nr:hypothetical protein [Nitrososphaerota archaeon]MDG6942116.1 hypothetical protein [Nitrososphaerota archaeon]MDG6942581.1 hypothetical protein [Nitrososphaerota archaeon]MDG6948368.1 hypothetical protein [Nitrososphaerota archaeon]MDG6950294.1 hypothetical protein [Nitrososphaerota archaeon]